MNGQTNTSETIARAGMMSHESEGEEFTMPPFLIRNYRGLRKWLARAYHENGETTLEATGETKIRARLALLDVIERWEEANK